MHEANIVIHVLSGTIALLLGVAALLSKKGTSIHLSSGRYFLGFMSIVIFTGLVGVFVFGRNSFLLVVTILAGYNAFSGYRVLKFKSNAPKNLDMALALVSLLVVAYYLYYFKSIGMIWNPVIIYSTVGALLFVVAYDFLRYLIPGAKYKKNKIWIYEHIYKLTSAFGGLLAAFTGTVLDQYQPYSQILPSVFSISIILGFSFYVYKYGLRKI